MAENWRFFVVHCDKQLNLATYLALRGVVSQYDPSKMKYSVYRIHFSLIFPR